MERGGGIKGFVATPLGKVALTALAALILLVSFIYVSALIAIAAFLLFMFAAPIYLGWKRPRQLAVAALAAILVAGAAGSVLYAQQLRVPSPAVSSDPQTGVNGTGTGSVLANAAVHPGAGDAGSNFVFSATVNPQYLPAGAHGPEFVVLYLSTCAGATTPNSSLCGGGGYLFWTLNQSFTQNASTLVTFTKTLHVANLWWWLMAFVYNNSTGAFRFVWVDPGSPYGAVQGPVVGDLLSTTGLLLPAIFTELFLYVASVFFGALAIYVLLKSREARRNREAGPPLGGPAAEGGAPGSPPSSGKPSAYERNCAKCGAVIYPSETTCWKCGSPIAAESAPLAP